MTPGGQVFPAQVDLAQVTLTLDGHMFLQQLHVFVFS